MRQYQLVVFGASGFTGRLICEHIAKSYQGKFRWAMAGRKQAKLEEVRAELAETYPSIAEVDILVADSFDYDSLLQLTKSTDVVITTVGPYARYGKPLVKACVEAVTHYTDLTGEVHFVRDCVDSFHEEAVKKAVRIVHCCGFDCVPSDLLCVMAADHMRKNHGQEVGVATALLLEGKGGMSGGTTESGIGVFQLPAEQRVAATHPYCLVPEKAGIPVNELPGPSSPFRPVYLDVAQAWTAPSLMAGVNTPVAQRTGDLLGFGDKFVYFERLQLNGSLFMATLATAGVAAFGASLAVAARVPFLRGWLPKPGEGPDRATMTNGCWKFKMLAASSAPDSDTVVEAHIADMHGDPGYMSTSRMVLECALALALEPEALAADPFAGKHRGGVLTAGCLGLVLVKRLKTVGLEASTNDVVQQ